MKFINKSDSFNRINNKVKDVNSYFRGETSWVQKNSDNGWVEGDNLVFSKRLENTLYMLTAV